MKAWFMQLKPRERVMVGLGTILLAIFLLYALVWLPFTKHLTSLRQSVQEQKILVQWMQESVEEVRRLRSGSSTPGQLPAGQSLLAVVDQSAKNSQLGAVMKRVEPEGQNTARVWFEQANFDDLVQWLDAIQGAFGLRVTSIVLERQDTPGLINARVSLETSAL